jgi:phosphomannomutase
VRGRVGYNLDESIAYRIGRAFAQYFNAKRIVVGCDARLSSPSIKAAVVEGLLDAGSDVVDLGLAGTEEIYFASFHLDVDGGIEVTASHNPADHNGMKFICRGGRPLRVVDELVSIRALTEANTFAEPEGRGTLSHLTLLETYTGHLLDHVNVETFMPMKIVVDAGNGAAGHVIDSLAAILPKLQFVKINHNPDGHFPGGVPNPLLPERRLITSQAVRYHRADIGIAWDGDFDRCFLYDGNGEYVSGYYLTGLLMQAFMEKLAAPRFVIDPRLNWNTLNILKNRPCAYVVGRTGHTFFKEMMRSFNADYGGETSSHHYFKDFAYNDSGMIPWLMLVEHLSKCGQSLADLIATRKAMFPCSDEINFSVADGPATIQHVLANYGDMAHSFDFTDGIGLEFEDWRFNLRGSNTEDLLRLNIESRANPKLVSEKVAEISDLIGNFTA